MCQNVFLSHHHRATALHANMCVFTVKKCDKVYANIAVVHKFRNLENARSGRCQKSPPKDTPARNIFGGILRSTGVTVKSAILHLALGSAL